MEKATFLQCLFNWILLMYIINISIQYLKKQECHKNSLERKIFVLCALFCILGFWAGDYWHLIVDYKNLLSGNYSDSNVEKVYRYIATFAPTYLSFRLFIWGGVIFFVYKINKLISPLGCNKEFIYFFVTLCLMMFSYARVSLSMAIIYYCLTYFCLLPKHNIKNCIFLLFLLFASSFFHKSALFGIFVSIIAYLIHRVNSKYTYILMIIAIPPLLKFASNQMEMLLFIDPTEETSFNLYAARDYIDKDNYENITNGWGVKIHNFLFYPIFYLSLIQYIVIRIKEKTMPSIIKIMGDCMAIIICSVTIIYFYFGDFMYIMYYRLLNYALLPCSIFLAYIYNVHRKQTLSKILYYLCLCSTVYWITYSTYNIL